MPTYQYACTDKSCGHRFEAVQSFTDDALTTCPVCEGKLRKVYSAVGIVFKGSGFYRTDSRNGQTSTAPAKSAESTSNGSSSDSAPSTSDKAASSTSSSAKDSTGSSSSSTSTSSANGSSSSSSSSSASKSPASAGT